MDPEARRQLWEVIAEVSDQRSVVITTHSMEVDIFSVVDVLGVM